MKFMSLATVTAAGKNLVDVGNHPVFQDTDESINTQKKGQPREKGAEFWRQQQKFGNSRTRKIGLHDVQSQ
jgi:hypothetical protein